MSMGPHVPSPLRQCALARKGVQEALPRAAGRFGGSQAHHVMGMSMLNSFYAVSLVDVVLWCHSHI